MNIGIVPDLRSAVGGVYQYSLTILDALRQWTSDGCKDEFTILTDVTQHAALQNLRPGWRVQSAEPPSLRRSAKRTLTRMGLDRAVFDVLTRLRNKDSEPEFDMVRSRPEQKRWLEGLGVELIFYPNPETRSFEIGLPYIMSIHDLQHRLQPEFPEVSANGVWKHREYLFRNAVRHANALIADSEIGKEDILNFYGEFGASPDKVKVLPFLPASYLPAEVSPEERQRVRTVHKLPERFLFYPAQFWPHKNHARIVKALGLLGQRQIEVPVVFCGSKDGVIRQAAFKEVMQLGHECGVSSQIVNLGYVPEEDMAALYAEAAALIMPTFFGPTNIPVLEAWRFGCPVITSDIRGIREQVGDAAFLVDPKSVESIAEGIAVVWTDPSRTQTVAARGRQRLASYTADDFRMRLIRIIEEAKAQCGVC